jgi:hypothetical protein
VKTTILALAICNVASVAAIIGAIILAASGHNGWGWLIFAALLLHTSVSSTPDADGDES